jgi:hypothetical protein
MSPFVRRGDIIILIRLISKSKKKSLFGLFVSTKVNFIKCNITQNTCAFKKTQLWMRLMV